MSEFYVWCGWTPYESTYEYDDIRNLYVMQYTGEAYGMYQFDYRWGLIPFMQFCVNHTSNYNGFQPYIALGAGNPALIGNEGLHSLFQTYATQYTDDFRFCQNQMYLQDYLNPVLVRAESLGLNVSNPYIRGTLGSMAIRQGYASALVGQAITEMANGDQTNVIATLSRGYAVFDAHFYAQGDYRWGEGRPGYLYGGQLGRVKNDLNAGLQVYDLNNESPDPPPPPPPPPWIPPESNLLKFIEFYGLEDSIFNGYN